MTKISYFQKYSQKENHVTNNTLLMLSHLYRHDISRFKTLLSDILDDEEVEVGLVFKQQEKLEESVPDGFIYQEAFNLYLEAKLDGDLSKEQMERHIGGVRNKHKEDHSQICIVGLTKDKISDEDLECYKSMCQGVATFASITYSDLVDLLRDCIPEYETGLTEIVNDYECFLESVGMIAHVNPLLMITFPCGTSGDENVKHQVYYEPKDRPSRANIPFIGIYRRKRITHIGKIKGAIIASYKDGKLVVKSDDNKISPEDKNRVCDIIKAATYHPGLGEKPHRYYIIGDVQEVNLKKISRGGQRGKRFFDLSAFCPELKEGMSVAEIAEKIRGKSFE